MRLEDAERRRTLATQASPESDRAAADRLGAHFLGPSRAGRLTPDVPWMCHDRRSAHRSGDPRSAVTSGFASSPRWESNPRRSHYECDPLPTEVHGRRPPRLPRAARASRQVSTPSPASVSRTRRPWSSSSSLGFRIRAAAAVWMAEMAATAEAGGP